MSEFSGDFDPDENDPEAAGLRDHREQDPPQTTQNQPALSHRGMSAMQGILPIEEPRSTEPDEQESAGTPDQLQ